MHERGISARKKVIEKGDTTRIVNGTEIRQNIYNKQSWVPKVPRGTREILEQWLRAQKGRHFERHRGGN